MIDSQLANDIEVLAIDPALKEVLQVFVANMAALNEETARAAHANSGD